MYFACQRLGLVTAAARPGSLHVLLNNQEPGLRPYSKRRCVVGVPAFGQGFGGVEVAEKKNTSPDEWVPRVNARG